MLTYAWCVPARVRAQQGVRQDPQEVIWKERWSTASAAERCMTSGWLELVSSPMTFSAFLVRHSSSCQRIANSNISIIAVLKSGIRTGRTNPLWY